MIMHRSRFLALAVLASPVGLVACGSSAPPPVVVRTPPPVVTTPAPTVIVPPMPVAADRNAMVAQCQGLFAQSLTGQAGRLSLIQIAAPGSANEVDAAWRRIAAALAGTRDVDVRPLRPVVESEARVIMKVRGLMLGLAETAGLPL